MTRDALAPTPDYGEQRPALDDPEPCGCEESGALRAKMFAIQMSHQGIVEMNAECIRDRDAERRKRLELERGWATMLVERFGNTLTEETPEGVPASVMGLAEAHQMSECGVCDRCGKRAPLTAFGRGCDDDQVGKECAWSCEVT